MKPYFEAGLKELARVSGYPTAAIQSCSKFKRTHYFIIEAWEALYQIMVTKFMEFQENETSLTLPNREVNDIVTSAISKVISKEDNITCLIAEVHRFLSESNHFTSFIKFIETISKTNSTWKF